MNQSSINDAIQLHPDLWQIKNLLIQDELGELLHRVTGNNSWEKLELQKSINRESMVWHNDNLLDWLWTKLNTLNFSKFELAFRTVMLWRDQEGYTIGNHIDNSQVTAAMQIYVSPTMPDIGTWFLNEIEIPFVQNTGYLMNNRNNILHGMKNSVPQGYTRISLYALFDSKT